MQDGIIKGTGNSRLLKSAITEATTWEQFRAALIAGTLPIDLAGINADGWQQLATALSKGNLLSDATAGKLDGVETPDAALSLLGRFQRGMGNEYVWSKTKSIAAHYVASEESQTTIVINQDGGGVGSFYTNCTYSQNVQFDPGTQTYTQTNVFTPPTYPSSGTVLQWNSILPFYCKTNAGTNAGLYRVVSVASSTTNYITFNAYKQVFTLIPEQITVYGYVNSPDSAAYPPSVSDGYTYTLLGQIGNKVRIATGSYTGTGTYGSSNPTTITLPFAAKLLILLNASGRIVFAYDKYLAIGNPSILTTSWSSGLFWSSNYNASPPDLVAKKSSDGKTISWYHVFSADYQFNNSGGVYNWLAIG